MSAVKRYKSGTDRLTEFRLVENYPKANDDDDDDDDDDCRLV